MRGPRELERNAPEITKHLLNYILPSTLRHDQEGDKKDDENNSDRGGDLKLVEQEACRGRKESLRKEEERKKWEKRNCKEIKCI